MEPRDKDSDGGAPDTILDHLAGLFHTQTTVLTRLIHALRPAMTALSPDPFPHDVEPKAEDLAAVLSPAVSQCLDSIEKLISTCEQNWRDRSIPELTWSNLKYINTCLREFKADLKVRAAGPHTVRTIARTLIDLTSSSDQGLPREGWRTMLRNARDVERLVCLFDLHRAEAQIIGLGYEVDALRVKAKNPESPYESPQPVRLSNLLQQEITTLKDFAISRRVRFRYLPANSVTEPIKLVGEDSMRRAFRNILHNAVKYSGAMRGDELAWVDIRLSFDREMACIEVENWGAPITPEELAQGLPFAFGYRGIFSRTQTGSGIGLADAKQVIELYGGTLEMSSKPARHAPMAQPFSVPYITTVVIHL